jgi:hypothetical protein
MVDRYWSSLAYEISENHRVSYYCFLNNRYDGIYVWKRSFRPRFSYAIIEKELQENLGLERLSWEGLWADLLLDFLVSHIEWTYPLDYQGMMIDERFSYWQRLTRNTSKFPVIKDEISLL